MDESLTALTGDMTGARREVFERVWRRVMHSGAAEDIPLPEEGPLPEGGPLPERDSLPEKNPLPKPAEAGALALPTPPPDLPRGDFPKEPGVLGEGCREYVGLLQGLIRGALEDWRSYQVLARRAGGGPGRVLAALGAEQKRRARELCAACFLISGVRFWPDPEKAAPPRSYLGALRRLFRREQEAMASCLAGAETVSDPCLQELFLRHAKEAWDRSCRLRALVEQA